MTTPLSRRSFIAGVLTGCTSLALTGAPTGAAPVVTVYYDAG